MKNNKGFTLIELIVCIAIIAALGVTIGMNSSQMTSDAQKDKCKANIKEIMDAAAVYYELNSVSDKDHIRIKKLIEKGLLENSILNEKNPLCTTGELFKEDNIVKVVINDGKKIVTMECGGNEVSSNNIESYNWENC